MTPYVYFKLDRLRAALRQTDVRLLTTMASVDTSEMRDHVFGWHPVGAGHCPVFCTDEHLRPAQYTPEQRRYCIIIAAGTDAFGLAVDEFKALDSDSTVTFRTLPACMTTATPLAEGIGVFNDEIYTLVSVTALLHQLNTQDVSQ